MEVREEKREGGEKRRGREMKEIDRQKDRCIETEIHTETDKQTQI